MKATKPTEKTKFDSLKDGINGLPGGEKTKPYKDKVTKFAEDKRRDFAWWYDGKKQDVKDSYNKTADSINQDRENKAHDAPWWDKKAQSVGNKIDEKAKGIFGSREEKIVDNTDKKANLSLQVTDKLVVFRNLCHFVNLFKIGMTHYPSFRLQQSVRTTAIW